MKKQSGKKRKYTKAEVYILFEALMSDIRTLCEFISAMDKQLDRILELFHKSKVDRKDFEILEKRVASITG